MFINFWKLEYSSIYLRFYGLYVVGPEVGNIVKIPAWFIFSMKIFTENLLFQIPFHHRLAAVLPLNFMAIWLVIFSQSVCRFSQIRSQHVFVLSTNVKIFVRKRIKRLVLELWGFATERVFSRPCVGNPKHRFHVDPVSFSCKLEMCSRQHSYETHCKDWKPLKP